MTSECTELVLMSEKHDAINAPVKEHGDQTVDAARRGEGLGHHLLLHLVGKGGHSLSILGVGTHQLSRRHCPNRAGSCKREQS